MHTYTHNKEQLPTVRCCTWTSACAVPTGANPPHATAVDDRLDRQTDGQTTDRYIDPALHALQTASKITRRVIKALSGL